MSEREVPRPSSPIPHPRLVILADDLTGACDAAVPFATRGLATVVLLEPPRVHVEGRADADVAALDVDTRRLGRRPAVARTAAAARSARASGAASLYKKIDSTLRGHVGAELDACLRAWDAPLAVLCPAFPATGRWVQGGRLHVDGRGEIGAVRDLAGFGRRARVAELPLDVLERGPRNVALVLEGLARSGARVVVADANAPWHLATLAEAAARLDPPPLLAGSAGLAHAVAGVGCRGHGVGDERTIPPPPTPNTRHPTPAGPWLVVAGSQTETTAAQVAKLEQAGAVAIGLDADGLVDGRHLGREAGSRAADVLAEGRTPVLRLLAAGGTEAPRRDARRAEDRAARALGRACRAAVEREPPAGLFMTGGLTARACLLALGARGLRLKSEPLPGIALSRALGGTWDGRLVITKAGGFGASDAIRRLVMAT